MNFNKNKLSLLILGAIIISGTLYFYTSGKKKSASSPLSRLKNIKLHKKSLKKLDVNKEETQVKNTQHQQEKKNKFSNTKEILKLKKNFKDHKEQIIKFINSTKAFNEKTEPHTTEDFKEQDLGALKVLALQVLVENEKSQDLLAQDLVFISKNAADPTIKEISKSILKSKKNGRPFFKDMIEALDDLEL